MEALDLLPVGMSLGIGLMFWLLNRSVQQIDDRLISHDARHETHDKEISELKIITAKHDTGLESINQQYGQLREDMKEVKNDVKEVFKLLTGRAR